ncbi:RagB/SusD family nutrient uptake outer membrane protein [Reichenbachiella versicolor]|uniref:RagB/SusD family nutrient uptake outer membrane protein n=1 Tax=Reichenbachiella versicolor TaxID=1821036 RepID=UPI000D6E612A|nr:RagB/SusD family nutrient uptake outer membrane protein [Reichenbachiella versicolor]
MKKLINTIWLAAAVLVFASCDEDKFLTETNPNSILDEEFWESEQDYQKALNTVYGALQLPNVSGDGTAYDAARTDLGGSVAWVPHIEYSSFKYNDASVKVREKWRELYLGVHRANQVIDRITADSSDLIEPDVKLIMEGEARFLRAFFYFDIIHTYGGAVYHDTFPKSDEDFHKPMKSIKFVTDSLIIPDMMFAQDNLPTSWDGNDDIGKATWGAATAMLGKAYLYQRDWANAAAEFKKIIDSNIYSLTANVIDNFNADNEFNEESIFEVTFSEILKEGLRGNKTDDDSNGAGAEANWLPGSYSKLNYGGFNSVMPTLYLHEMFTRQEVDVTDPQNSLGGGDTRDFSMRMHGTIAPKNFEGLYYNRTPEESNGWGGQQNAYVKKYTSWHDREIENQVLARSGINFRHIRYADILLMYAEAILEEHGDDVFYINVAIQMIDEVRDRAGIVTLTEYLAEPLTPPSFPAYHISEQVPNVDNGNSAAEVRVEATAENLLTHIRYVERPLELCFEGHRMKDLIRWGVIKEQFDRLYIDEQWRTENAWSLSSDLQYTGVRPDFFEASTGFTDELKYFPVPVDEVQTNRKLYE